MSKRIEDFYTDPAFKQPIYRARAGNVAVGQLVIPNTDVYIGDSLPNELKLKLCDNVERLYDSIKPRIATIDGNDYTFEVGLIEGTGNETELRVASYQSSLTGNYGNGFEIAAMAAENPQNSYLYVASLGMGLSSPITAKEQKYLKKYGRLLQEEDGIITPLPVVRALGKVIFDMDLGITRLGSDSAGALLTMSYGAIYGKGAITSAHQNVRTGIKDIRLAPLMKGMMWDDGQLSKRHALVSRDALRMNAEKIDFVKANLGQNYLDKNYQPHKMLAMLWAYARGLGKGPKHGDPLISDNVAFARANPDANILFTVGDQDPLARSNDLDERVHKIVHDVSLHSEATVSAAVVKGGNHGIQTHYPQFLRALATTALK